MSLTGYGPLMCGEEICQDQLGITIPFWAGLIFSKALIEDYGFETNERISVVVNKFSSFVELSTRFCVILTYFVATHGVVSGITALLTPLILIMVEKFLFIIRFTPYTSVLANKCPFVNGLSILKYSFQR
ncbi:15220_t:CDS:2 [Dentiscutata erythropus]|uniref:15220_t:CDS:1 n=1 Tax=Dentiscutata erythropus TaxID=1348616 RepID=A0A9N9CP55_9GLOM|nr:15220_t:CDS:2 [Dentiscutata erythropus]